MRISTGQFYESSAANYQRNFANVVKSTVFITDMGTFAAVNEVYKKYFTAPCPARSCVEVSKLPLGAQVEVEVIASL